MKNINAFSDTFTQFQSELEQYKSSFSYNRFRWLKSIDEETSYDKLCTAHGYLMAVKELDKPIGELKVLLEQMLQNKKTTDVDVFRKWVAGYNANFSEPLIREHTDTVYDQESDSMVEAVVFRWLIDYDTIEFKFSKATGEFVTFN